MVFINAAVQILAQLMSDGPGGDFLANKNMLSVYSLPWVPRTCLLPAVDSPKHSSWQNNRLYSG